MTMVHEPETTTGTLVDLALSRDETAALERVCAATAELACGGTVLMCDDAEQPGRGEILFAAAGADVHATAFAVRHTSGFLHVALPASRCDELDLVSQRGADRTGIAQCVTVDANDGIGTGISAADRAVTARLLASDAAREDSFTRPGHVVPLRAELDLPLRAYGYAEAGLHLVRAAGLAAAAVMGTVVGIADPTSMAAGEEVHAFAAEHRLPLVGIRDLAVGATPATSVDLPLQLPTGRTRLMSFDAVGEEYLCLVVGDVTDRAEVPLHIVAADRIVLEASMQYGGPRILLGVRAASNPADQRALIVAGLREEHDPLREVLRSTGARSLRRTFDPDSWSRCN